MFQIAICDDEQLICSQIEDIILDYQKLINEKIEIEIFYSGEELYRYMEKGHYFDLIFLDIELKEINGVKVGRKIREEMDDQTVQIVYVSGRDSYYRDLFEVRPMHFLSKPIDRDKVIKDIELAMKLTDKLDGTFNYKKGHIYYKIPFKNIIYFESLGREIKMVSTQGEELFYGKLKDVYHEVAKHHFLYIHKSYIVNYAHVTIFKYDEVTMSNTICLPISQSRRTAIRELQLEFEKSGLYQWA
ncbi:LytTR family DNA-binding domain-containing protein [Irregularibacter muris]|uniref:Stage 0 sporulation protein A homolog n=1 Tax=Irregularibacter muris TaxID=1796619 RepID=A0AAE3HFH4_9FIRM|nr:LytTR family DNA-binding domain-containing protein [Irregularibacter muris]MCR1898494.1 LytTR family DNA-binding domain-containing protein [Irregularibacter muris]